MHREKRKYEIKMMICMNEMNYLCDKINETRGKKIRRSMAVSRSDIKLIVQLYHAPLLSAQNIVSAQAI